MGYRYRNAQKASTATLWAERGRIFVRSTFSREWVDSFKTLVPPGSRSWEPAQKVWSFDPAFIEEVHSLCNAHFDSVTVMEDESAGPSSTGSDNAYEELLAPLPDRVLKKVGRAILAEVHPDKGGDPELAARVTAAWNAIKQARGI